MEQTPSKKSIGYVVGGSLKENLTVRLTTSPQEVQEGAFVVLESGTWNYYGLVTNMMLGATNPRFADEQSEARYPEYLARQLHGQTLFTNLEVLPTLMMDQGPDLDSPEYEEWAKTHPVDTSDCFRSRRFLRTIPMRDWQRRWISPPSLARKPMPAI